MPGRYVVNPRNRRITVTMEQDLAEKLFETAKLNERSVSDFMRVLFIEYLASVKQQQAQDQAT